jgi:ribosome biogenesis GTPase
VSSDTLERLGWTEARRQEFAALPRAPGLVPGRVVLEHNHVYRVWTAAGECLAEAAGRLKHEAAAKVALPVVGDWVALRLDPSGGHGQIRDILTRRTSFSRKVAGRTTEEQVLAANVDTVFVTYAIEVRLNLRGIERYLVAAERSGADPVVILNKADLAADVEAVVAGARAALRDIPVLTTSARTGAGLDAIAPYLTDGRTVAFLGPSGAGKSSIVNRLVGDERLPTGEVRPWDARGRHTSVHRELVVRAEGGLIIDTPGIRELQIWDSDVVDDAFGDILDLAAACRFRDCRHDREPGCAVKAAVDAGSLDAGRYGNFLKLQREEAILDQRKDVRAQQESKRATRIQGRAARALKKDRQRNGR